MDPVTCPECRAPIGPPTSTDIYKHAIQCLHLPNTGIEQLLSLYGDKDDERSKRIAQVMHAAKAGR